MVYRREYTEKNKAHLNAKATVYYAANRERLVEQSRAYTKAHPEMRKLAKVKMTHGLTAAQYQAMLASQQGVCAVCRLPFPSPKKTHVDHCHISGKIRGILCHYCNTALGSLGDSPERCEAAAIYLERKRIIAREG